MKRKLCVLMFVAICLCLTAQAAIGEDLDSYKYQIGIRGGMSLADGEPANDLITYGIYGRYNLNDSWNIGLSVDNLTGDFEDPAFFIGVPTVKEKNDATMSNVVITMWGEREFTFSSETFQRLRPYAALGLGVGIVNVDDVADPDVPYVIKTDGGTEFVPAFALGLRYLFSKNWETELSAVYSYHVADWQVTDIESGTTGSLGNYSTVGFYLGLGYRF